MKSRARQRGKEMAGTVEHWFRRKYLLPPNDPRFLEATPEEMLTDYWAWHYFANPNEQEVVDDEFDLDSVLADMENNPEDWEEA